MEEHAGGMARYVTVPCDLCGRKFVTKQKLNEHKQSKHGGETSGLVGGLGESEQRENEESISKRGEREQFQFVVDANG